MLEGRKACWNEESEESAGWRTAWMMQASGIIIAMCPTCHALPKFLSTIQVALALSGGIIERMPVSYLRRSSSNFSALTVPFSAAESGGAADRAR